MTGLDVILGMDWLSANHVLFDKTLSFQSEPSTPKYGNTSVFMSANQVRASFKEGA